MSSKRALVVDDSKSARAFLSRILERHEIAVDAAESAEAAIEYLARHKPDVIFMDHLMPGMDGFQAVQTIKNNPRTSSIPILMYTSQEGDLYLGQARALGAAGVLPKQIRQSDVTRMLFQLRLVSDRRASDRDQTTFQPLQNVPDLAPANESAIIVQNPAEPAPDTAAADAALAELLPKMALEIRAAVDASLQREVAALRGFIGGKLDAHADRMQGDLSALLPAPRTPEVDSTPIIPERRLTTIFGWTLALLASAGVAVMGWLWWDRGGEIAALQTDLGAAYAELEELRARPVAAPAVLPEAPAERGAPGAVMPVDDVEAVSEAGAVSTQTLVPTGGVVEAPAAAPVATGVTDAATASSLPAEAAPAAAPEPQAQ
jgi:CheY-like chemotaxis protein